PEVEFPDHPLLVGSRVPDSTHHGFPRLPQDLPLRAVVERDFTELVPRDPHPTRSVPLLLLGLLAFVGSRRRRRTLRLVVCLTRRIRDLVPELDAPQRALHGPA